MGFYPENTPVPEEKRTERLFLRPLRATDVELDYDAVMSSAEQLRRWCQSKWPADPNVAYFFDVAAGFSLRITQPKGCDYLDPRIHPR